MEKLNFGLNIVKKGTKSKNEAYPALRLVSTPGNFKLNDLACAALGITPGVDDENEAIFIDMFPNVTSQDDRYFIANGIGVDGAVKVSSTNLLSHASIYNTMLLGDHEVKSATNAVLFENDLLQKTEKSKVATWTVTGELVPYNNGEPVEVGEHELVVYAITNFKRVERDLDTDDDEPVVEEVENVEE